MLTCRHPDEGFKQLCGRWISADVYIRGGGGSGGGRVITHVLKYNKAMSDVPGVQNRRML